MNSLHSTIFPESSTAQLTLGGAFLRIWRKDVGLTLEMPACVAIEKDTRAVVAFGEEAQQLEGREPAGISVVRPFFADRIVDRELLRGLLIQALTEDRQRLPHFLARSAAFLSTSVMISPTVSTLHRRWVTRTLREVGLWTAPMKESFASVALNKTQRARGLAVVAVVDVGFSATRLIVYLGETPILSESWPNWSVSTLCQRVVEEEERATKVRFSPSTFYGQDWSLKHAAFDLERHEAVFGILQKKTLTRTFQDFSHELSAAVQDTLLRLEPNTLAQLSHHGIVVVGGGSTIPELTTQLESSTHLPTEIQKNAIYAEVRF